MAESISGRDDRKTIVMRNAEELKDDAKREAQHIEYELFGTDKNKQKKNQKGCDRGANSGAARYCSAHIRKIYNADILGDNQQSEYCVIGRHNENCCINTNPCNLCNINPDNYMKTATVNLASSINVALGGNTTNNNDVLYQQRLLSFMLSHIGADYPGTKKEYTILRIRVNNEIWLEYYVKLTAFSSLLKTSAPSGYKYKDRISLGRMIRIQGNKNKDLLFYLTKDENYDDAEEEKKRPVVNCVGFWNLLNKTKNGEIRNIIHLNIDQASHISFGFLIKNPPNNVHSIQVELVCTKHGLGLKNTVLSLWRYSQFDNNSNSSPYCEQIQYQQYQPPRQYQPYQQQYHQYQQYQQQYQQHEQYQQYQQYQPFPVVITPESAAMCYGPTHSGIHIGSSQNVRYSPLRNNNLILPPPVNDDLDNISIFPGYPTFNDDDSMIGQPFPMRMNPMNPMNPMSY